MKRTSLLLFTAFAIAAALFAACGGDDDAPPATTGSSASKTVEKTASIAKSPTTAAPTAIKLPNATTTASGLQYVDTKVGTGASPRLDQSVTVNYTGKLASNGQVFDSTDGKGPATFGMQQVIKGFQEALSTMKVGGKRTVLIPSALAYGAPGHPPQIPPNSDLVFDLELIAVK